MKSKIVIENGETTILLTPENDFEKRMIEDIVKNKGNHTVYTDASTTHQWHEQINHKIEISIKETRP